MSDRLQASQCDYLMCNSAGTFLHQDTAPYWAHPILKELDDVFFVTDNTGLCHLHYSPECQFDTVHGSWDAPAVNIHILDRLPPAYHQLVKSHLADIVKTRQKQKFLIHIPGLGEQAGLWLQCQISILGCQQVKRCCDMPSQSCLLWVVRDITDMKQAEILLHQAAMTDVLTGIGNRRNFDKMITQRMSEAHHRDENLILAILDLDYFKQVNDQFGHIVGDELLQKIAGSCQDFIDLKGEVFRLGGEEFAILLPNITESDADDYLNQLRTHIAQQFYVIGDIESISCTVSIGFTEFSGAPVVTSSLLVAADQALYRAKAAGRNCCCS